MAENVAGFDPDVSIEMGTPLKLEFFGVPHRYDSVLLGFNPGRYAMVSVPTSTVGLSGKLRRGNLLTVRYLCDGTAYAFQAQILGIITDPAHLIFLGCPKHIQEYPLRSEPRLAGNLPCRIRTDNLNVSAVVSDINSSGCCCLCGDSAAEMLYERIEAELELGLQLPGVAEEVVLTGVLRSVTNGEGKTELGVQFDTSANSESMDQIGTYLDTLAEALSGPQT